MPWACSGVSSGHSPRYARHGDKMGYYVGSRGCSNRVMKKGSPEGRSPFGGGLGVSPRLGSAQTHVPPTMNSAGLYMPLIVWVQGTPCLSPFLARKGVGGMVEKGFSATC
jgi:hypothetical protein